MINLLSSENLRIIPLSSNAQLIKAEGEIAATVSNVMDLAYADWQQNKSSHWSEIVPFYGQHPVNIAVQS